MLSRSSKSKQPSDEAVSERAGPVVGPSRGHPTIATIAAHMGLSRATVTHVLNGRAAEQRIRSETQERVLAVARELGYRPNASARAVRAGRFGSIALIQSLLGQYLPAELLCGLTSAITAQDLHLVLTEVANVDMHGEADVARAMRELSVDGVLVNRHGGAPTAVLERIRQLQIPAIFLNTKQDFDCIHPDDRMGGRLATQFLLGLGHERVAYVETEPRHRPHYSESDRRAGYADAVTAAGKTPWVYRLPIAWNAPGEPHEDQRIASAMRLLAGAERPTAVLAYELAEAMAVVHAAHRLGLHIPADLSLVQFHSSLDARCFLPVHTVSNRMREVGEGAVSMLMEKIDDPARALAARVVPETLLEGVTCAPPRRPLGPHPTCPDHQAA